MKKLKLYSIVLLISSCLAINWAHTDKITVEEKFLRFNQEVEETTNKVSSVLNQAKQDISENKTKVSEAIQSYYDAKENGVVTESHKQAVAANYLNYLGSLLKTCSNTSQYVESISVLEGKASQFFHKLRTEVGRLLNEDSVMFNPSPLENAIQEIELSISRYQAELEVNRENGNDQLAQRIERNIERLKDRKERFQKKQEDLVNKQKEWKEKFNERAEKVMDSIKTGEEKMYEQIAGLVEVLSESDINRQFLITSIKMLQGVLKSVALRSWIPAETDSSGNIKLTELTQVASLINEEIELATDIPFDEVLNILDLE